MLYPSLLRNDCEQWEYYISAVTNKTVCQYDYRSLTGELFSCIDGDVVAARQRSLKFFQHREHEKMIKKLKHFILESSGKNRWNQLKNHYKII